MNKKIMFEHIIQNVQSTIARFPVPVTLSIIGTVISLLLLHNNDTDTISRLFYTLALAFPLSIAVTLLSERNNKKALNFSIFGAFIVLYYFFIGKNLFTVEYDTYRIQYVLWILASVFLVTFIPYVKKISSTVLGFWQYNQRILYALLATAFYSAAIYAGLSIALFAVNTLFDLNIDGIRWAELGTLIFGLFSTTFFLARFPHAEESAIEYPKELRMFSFYVLVPLVAIYVLILYSYSGKIILSQEWPKGIISSMILGFSMLGICTYALLYPLIRLDELLQKISRWFFVALLPQIVVLFLAVKLRIDEYAITEQRYFVVIFGVWLLVISLYFIFGKNKDIRTIPLSLCILIACISFGPWGAFQVSRDSQVQRIEGILVRNNMLVDGKIASTTTPISFKDRQEISEIILYLNQNHGLETIQPWFTQDLQATENHHEKAKRATELLGINFIDTYQNETNYYFTSNTGKEGTSQALKVTGYDYLVQDTYNATVLNGASYKFIFATTTLEYVVLKNDSEIARFPVKPLIERLIAEYTESGKTEYTVDELSLPFENNQIKMVVYFTSINGTSENMWAGHSVVLRMK